MGFLTREELEQLTGTAKPYVQRRVLDRHGIYYVESCTGKLTVTWHAVENPFTRKSSAANDNEERPNFKAIM